MFSIVIKRLLLASTIFLSGFVQAEVKYLKESNITNFFSAGTATVSVDNAPTGSTCSYWGSQFHFDATTDAGRNMFSIILAAHVGNKPINIWYEASTAPSTNETTGCDRSTMAVITQVGFRK